MKKRCFVSGCGNTSVENEELLFFAFPSDKVTKGKWISRCSVSPENIKTKMFACSIHFDEFCFGESGRRLFKFSLPSLFLPNFEVPGISRALPASEISDLRIPTPPPPENDNIIQRKIKELCPSCNFCTQSARNIRYYISKIDELKKVITKLRTNNNRYNKSRALLKKYLHRNKLKSKVVRKNSKENSKSNYHLLQSPAVKSNSQTFCQLLLRKNNYSYSENEKNLSENVYFKSPAAYKFMRDVLQFNLPSLSSLQRWIPVKNLVPGFNTNVLNLIRSRVNTMDDLSRNAVLVFDEVSIRRDLKYNSVEDQIEGFVDDGTNRKNKIGKQVIVFMVRGIFNNWKFVLTHFVSENAIKVETLRDLVFKNIKICQEMGLNIRATICDQGSNNRALYSSLSISENNPFFTLSGQKIYAMFDVPHLFKSMRNSLLKNDFYSSGPENANRTVVASWSVISNLYRQERSAAVKSCSKLTEAHINPTNFQKMSVKLSTQIFSHSVAAAIRTFHDTKKFKDDIKPKAIPTAEFIDKMNKLFDTLNSKTLSSRNVYNAALQESNTSRIFLEEMKSYVRNVYVPGNIHWKSGLVQTINGILNLLDEALETLNINFLFTSRFNQDIIENLFGLIRSKGGNNTHPSVYEINFIIAKIISMKLVFSSNTTNCETDDDDFLNFDWTEILSQKDSSAIPTTLAVEQSIVVPDLPQVHVPVLPSEGDNFENVNLPVDAASRRYFVGFILYKILPKIGCKECFSHLTNSSSTISKPSESLIFHKNFSQNSDFGSLYNPSEICFDVFNLHFDIFKRIFDKSPEIKNIKKTIESKCVSETESVFKNWFLEENICTEHRMKLMNYAILVLVRKHCAFRINCESRSSRKAKAKMDKIVK